MAYKLDYYFIYKLIEKRNNDAKFAASTFVFLSQLVQVFLILSIVKRTFNLDFSAFRFSDSYLANKLMMMPFLVLWFITVHLYYKRKFNKTKDYYAKDNVVTLKNGIIVFGSLILPLIIGILLLQK